MKAVTGALLCVLSIFMTSSFAAEESVLTSRDESAKTAEGWKLGFKIGLSGNWDYNRNTTSLVSGNYVLLGANLGFKANLKRNNHSWLNQIKLSEAFSRTPIIAQYLKSADELNAQSSYFYHIPQISWLGPFAEAALTTPIFAGFDVNAQDKTYVIDGVSEASAARSHQLSSAFQPMYLRQDLGLFADIFETQALVWRWLASWNMLEAFAQGAYSLTKKDAAATTVELKKLDNFVNMGPQLATNVSGTIAHSSLAYHLDASLMYPMIKIPGGTSRAFIDSLNLKFGAGLSYTMVAGLALEWNFSAIRIPDIVEKFQIQNGIMLSFNYEKIMG